MPRALISVLNWNGHAKTINCVRALQELTYPNAQILVVDNGSTDGSADHIRAALPETRLLCSPENLGYAGGHRLALEVALQESFDLLWLLNNDTYVPPDALDTLVAAYRQHGDALYGSVILSRDDAETILFAGGLDRAEDGALRRNDRYYNPLKGQPFAAVFGNQHAPLAVQDLNGSSFMVPVTVARTHGFMDETYFMYGEEQDYCRRMEQAGIARYLVPGSRVYHEVGGSFKGASGLDAVRAYYRRRAKLVFVRRFAYRSTFRRLMREHLRETWRMQVAGLLWPRRARQQNPVGYYEALGVRHALFNRMGKTLDPEDFR